MRYLKTETARAHRLTEAMVWCLLQVGSVRPSTWTALVRRGLADKVSENGPALYDFTATGQRVAEALVREVREEDETPVYEEEPADARRVTTTGTLIGWQAEDHGHTVTVHPDTTVPVRDGANGPEFLANGLWWETNDGFLTEETEPMDLRCDTEVAESDREVTSADGLPTIAEPQTTIAQEIHRGDVIVHKGQDVTVSEAGSGPCGTVTIRIGRHTVLTMPPTTPVRRAAQAQLALAV